jgi:N-acetyl-alpha-D-glucosaminyl L-malate synthase BshA
VRALKIGVLCHPTYGGSGVLASELALSLAQAGHSVHVFSHQVPARLVAEAGAVQVHVGQGLPYPLFQSPPHDLALISAILDAHANDRDGPFDVLHAHYAVPHAVSACVARAAAGDLGSRPPPRVVTTLHGTDITLVGSDPSYAPLTDWAIRRSDATTAVSEWLAGATRASFCSGAPCPIEVIPNFVDTERFRPLPSERASGQPTVVHVSNFRPVKRVPFLIEAFARARVGTDALLLLVGDGPEQGACRRRVSELGLESCVRFLGERDSLPELLAHGDVFALASREESFGLSALEAMSCGLPVVATAVGGVPEVVEQGVSGLLCAVDDLESFAAALRSLLSDRGRARELGRAARDVARERFERARIVPRYERLYARVLDGPRG